MEKLRENISRCQELAIPHEGFYRNDKASPFKINHGALSYRIKDSLNMLARPRRIPFEEEPVDSSIPRSSKVPSIVGNERDGNILTRLGRSATNRRRNQIDLDTYAQMVKRVPLSYRIPESLNMAKRPRRTPHQDESSIDNSPPRASNVRAITEGRNSAKLLTNRPRNHSDLDTYAQMVVDNDKQCPNRIKSLAKPRRSYIDRSNIDPWIYSENNDLCNNCNWI